MSFSQTLSALLRAPGLGIPAFSAGKGVALPLLRRYVQAADLSISEEEALQLTVEQAEKRWVQLRDKKLSQARVVLIGVPSDTGAGIRKGAAYGPLGLRTELLKLPDYVGLLRSDLVFDLGDLWVNPHFLHDEMLSKNQIKLSQDEMYSDFSAELRHTLPVSPLSQLTIILSLIEKINPKIKVFVVGGDHSIAWPISEWCFKNHSQELGIVQVDAHTDLLPSRLGVKYCFGSWSYHAAKLLGNDGRLVQLGIRQTGYDRSHWEKTQGVKQIWAVEVRSRKSQDVIHEVVTHLKSKGVKKLYFTNDIDGTDEREVSATGTPAPDGLSSTFVLELISGLGREFDFVAADVMELAPDLGPTPESKEKTGKIVARYALETIKTQLLA